MADEKDEGKKQDAEPDYKAQAAELQKKLLKTEEDFAYSQREIEKLKTIKKDHDANLNKQAEGGDKEAIKTLQDKHRNELAETEEKYKTRITKLETDFKRVAVSKEVITAASEYFNSDVLSLIEIEINKSCDWQDGQIVVKDDKGEVRYSPNDRRKPMTHVELLQELASKYKSCAKSTVQPGAKDSGLKMNGKNTDGLYTPEQLRSMTEQQRQAAYKVNPDNARLYLRTFSH